MLSSSSQSLFTQRSDTRFIETMNKIGRLYEVDHRELAKGRYDAEVQSCISDVQLSQNRDTLHRLAFVLFSGARVNYNCINKALLKKQWALLLFLGDSNSDFNSMIFVLRDIYQLWKEAKFDYEFEKPQAQALTYAGWHKYVSCDPEDDVVITHGGGYYFIQDFLNKKTPGYKLDAPGVGLQVHPNLAEKDVGRVVHYAYAHSWLHMDAPACLIGKIKAKYLCTQKNGYEAGLRSDVLDYLEGVKLIRLDHYWLGNGIEDAVAVGFYPNQPELEDQIRQSFVCFQQGENRLGKERGMYQAMKDYNFQIGCHFRLGQ